MFVKNVIKVISMRIFNYNFHNMKYFKYFSSREFFPSCTDNEIISCFMEGYFDYLLTLIDLLDAIREYVGYPILITSSYRDEKHNKAVKGSQFSQHLAGCAIDFKCPYVPFPALKGYVRNFLEESPSRKLVGQVIFYNKREFIHIGLRTPSHKDLTFLEYEKRDD